MTSEFAFHVVGRRPGLLEPRRIIVENRSEEVSVTEQRLSEAIAEAIESGVQRVVFHASIENLAAISDALNDVDVENGETEFWMLPLKMSATAEISKKGESIVLKSLRSWYPGAVPVSMGGPRRMSRHDVRLSIVAKQFCEGGLDAVAALMRDNPFIYELHPAWPYLSSAIDRLTPRVFSHYMLAVLDPRWLVSYYPEDDADGLSQTIDPEVEFAHFFGGFSDGYFEAGPVAVDSVAMFVSLFAKAVSTGSLQLDDLSFGPNWSMIDIHAKSSIVDRYTLVLTSLMGTKRLGSKRAPELKFVADVFGVDEDKFERESVGLPEMLTVMHKFLVGLYQSWLSNLFPPRVYQEGSSEGEPRKIQPSGGYRPELFLEREFFAKSEEAYKNYTDKRDAFVRYMQEDAGVLAW